jgi:hypothetical protein
MMNQAVGISTAILMSVVSGTSVVVVQVLVLLDCQQWFGHSVRCFANLLPVTMLQYTRNV